MKYLRIYADANGESHLEEVEVDLQQSGTRDISDMLPAKGVLFRRSPAGQVVDWHTAPRRQFVITLSGEGEIETSDGDRRRFGPGLPVLADDTTGKGHITRTLGSADRITLFVPLAD